MTRDDYVEMIVDLLGRCKSTKTLDLVWRILCRNV